MRPNCSSTLTEFFGEMCRFLVSKERVSQKVDNHVCKLWPLIFLEKMTGTHQGRMWLTPGTWNSLLEEAITPTDNRIRIAKHGQEWLLPASQDLPGFAIGFRGRIVGCRRDKQRKLAGRRRNQMLPWQV